MRLGLAVALAITLTACSTGPRMWYAPPKPVDKAASPQSARGRARQSQSMTAGRSRLPSPRRDGSTPE
jgi:hypothetical protein